MNELIFLSSPNQDSVAYSHFCMLYFEIRKNKHVHTNISIKLHLPFFYFKYCIAVTRIDTLSQYCQEP